MNAGPTARAARGAATESKLLAAAVGILRDEGAVAVSIQRVADAAGTSKGLVHYHFVDKDALLVACAKHITDQLVERETRALQASTAATALDDLWTTLASAESLGRRRALFALSTGVTAATRLVLDESAAQRQRASTRTVTELKELLQFDAPVSGSALSLAFLALMDGLSLSASGPMTAQHRQAYDAFWLAVLSLAD